MNETAKTQIAQTDARDNIIARLTVENEYLRSDLDKALEQNLKAREDLIKIADELRKTSQLVSWR